MNRLAEFFKVLREYKRHHSLFYSARIAYGIAYRGLPF